MMRATTVILGLVILTATAGQIEAGLVTDRGDLGSNDFIDWGTIPEAEGAIVLTPTGILSDGGISVTVSSAGGTIRPYTQHSSGGGTWGGDFSPGDHLINTGETSGPDITLDFGAVGVTAVGANIHSDYFGDYVAKITVYDGGGVELATFTGAGTTTGSEAGTAVFLGVKDVGDIHKVVFSLDSADFFPNDFAINQVDFAGPASVVPEPTSIALLGIGGLVLACGRYRTRRNADRPKA